MRANKIILLFIFFIVAYFLYFKEANGPLISFFSKVKNVFSTTQSTENPYKSPEKTENNTTFKEDVASAASSTASVQEVVRLKDKISGILDGVTEKSSNQTSSNVVPNNWLPVSLAKVEIVSHKNYVVGYNEKTEQAAWVMYKLKETDTYGDASRDGIEFMPDAKVSTQSALSSDYSRSGYDRGHLVPAGDFHCCQDLLRETFYMSNVSPQDRDFNRYIWNDLENAVRNWAKRYKEVYVITGPIISKTPQYIGKYNRVAVPSEFYKIVITKNGNSYRTVAFLIPNESSIANDSYFNFATTIDEIEKKAAIDFLSFLDDSSENTIEKALTKKL